jgi:hypothetical protein
MAISATAALGAAKLATAAESDIPAATTRAENRTLSCSSRR